MEGNPRPSQHTSLIFASDWPVPDKMVGELGEALSHGFNNWVVIPLPQMDPETLQAEADALSMRVQEPIGF